MLRLLEEHLIRRIRRINLVQLINDKPKLPLLNLLILSQLGVDILG